jgi:hypothetical protein
VSRPMTIRVTSLMAKIGFMSRISRASGRSIPRNHSKMKRGQRNEGSHCGLDLDET